MVSDSKTYLRRKRRVIINNIFMIDKAKFILSFFEKTAFLIGKIIYLSVCTITILSILLIAILTLYTGNSNLYYLEEAGIYIKTFPSRRYTIVAISENKIENISDSLDYIKFIKGEDYWPSLIFNPNKKHVIYDTGNHNMIQVHLVKYKLDILTFNRNDVNYDKKLEENPYVQVLFYFSGIKEELSLKNRYDDGYTILIPKEWSIAFP